MTTRSVTSRRVTTTTSELASFRLCPARITNNECRAVKLAQRQKMGSQFNLTQRPALAAQAERERLLAPVGGNSIARISGMPSTYTIAPNSTFDPDAARKDHRPLGANGMEAFRRMTAKQKKK